MSLSHESTIDPYNLLNLGSDDEDFFNELIEYTYIVEPVVLSSEKAIIKDVLDSVINIIANENVSTNQSNEESEQPPIITTIIISLLNTSDLKKCMRKKGSNIGQKRKAELVQMLRRLIGRGESFEDEDNNISNNASDTILN